MNKSEELLDIIELEEMSTIGRIENPKVGFLTITIHNETLGNLSLHLTSKSENYSAVLQLKDLKILEWKYNKNKLKSVPKTHLKALIKFLKAEDKYIPSQTNWRSLLIAWNKENPKFEKNIDMKIPIYKI